MQRHSVTSLKTARLLVNDHSGGGAEGEFPGNCNVSYLSFVYGSTGGACGRSLTAGKILFTGRQTCSLYLVLWLCDICSVLCTHISVLFRSKWREVIVMKPRRQTIKTCLLACLLSVATCVSHTKCVPRALNTHQWHCWVSVYTPRKIGSYRLPTHRSGAHRKFLPLSLLILI